MEATQLINLTRDIFEVGIKIYLQTVPGKWWESEYEEAKEPIKTNSIYGICVDGSTSIDYDFKTGKKEDNILKTFISQFISKYQCKQFIIKNNNFVYPTKKEVINSLKNSNRVSKYYFYTTLYGIGYFCIFMSTDKFNETNKLLSTYLKSKNILFTNEYSDANWVYRFVINKDVSIHNELLNNFKL